MSEKLVSDLIHETLNPFKRTSQYVRRKLGERRYRKDEEDRHSKLEQTSADLAAAKAEVARLSSPRYHQVKKAVRSGEEQEKNIKRQHRTDLAKYAAKNLSLPAAGAALGVGLLGYRALQDRRKRQRQEQKREQEQH